MTFSAARLAQVLAQWPTPGRYLLALSGGLDSSVLLHALSQIPDLSAPLAAIHVNHGIHADAEVWAQFCQRRCEALGVPLTNLEIKVQKQPGDSLEAKAREARYEAIASQMQAGDMLLVAQHADDQAETFLLQWLRGAGPRGLAGIPPFRLWRKGWQARPLLDFGRAELEDYARQHGLDWMEDPSNEDEGFDRNYLRQSILPELKQRWPGLLKTNARSARFCAQADSLCAELAALDIQAVSLANPWRLSISNLSQFSADRIDNLLRFWIERQGLPLPDETRLGRVRAEMLTAAEDRNPVVQWPGAELRRYRDQLCLMPPLPDEMPGMALALPSDGHLLIVPLGALGELRIEFSDALREKLMQNSLVLDFRTQGLSCTPKGRQGSRSFKRLAQDYGIPPWLRGLVPLLWIDGQLAAVGGICHCEPFGREDFQLTWLRPDYLQI